MGPTVARWPSGQEEGEKTAHSLGGAMGASVCATATLCDSQKRARI